MAERLAQAGQRVAVIERKHFGGTCVNTGCIPTKALVASAHAAHLAWRAANFGVGIDGTVSADMKRVKERKAAIVAKSRNGVRGWMERLPNGTVYYGHARFESPRTVRVNDELLEVDKIIVTTGSRAFVSQDARDR